MNNDDIRQYAKALKVRLWQIADVLGKSEAYVTRMLRHTLPEDERWHMMAIIDDIAQKRKREGM